jgi:diguanylate cyclase (GGDEF)-like protein
VLLSIGIHTVKVEVPIGRSSHALSVGYVVSFASLLLLGPGATTWVTMAGGWAECTFRMKSRNRWYQTAFSMSCLALSMEAAARTLAWTGGHGLVGPADVAIRSLVASSLVYFLVNSFLTSAVVALSTRRSFLKVWDQDFLWGAPNYFIGSFVAAFAVQEIQSWGYGSAAILILPLFLTFRLYKVYLGRVDDERRHVRELSEMHIATVEALALAIDAKDATARSHVQRVQKYASALAAAIKLPDDLVEGIRTAALLHDIGTLGVPDHILSKPGSLTEEEFDKVRVHAEIGSEIVAGVPFPYPVAPLIRHHHERWDGSGYPDALQGLDIPIGARIIAVADHFDSLRSERPYRPSRSIDEAIEELQREAGESLDPALVPTFVTLVRGIEHELEPSRKMTRRERGLPRFWRHATESAAGRDVFEDIARAQRELYGLYEVAQSMGTGLGVSDTMTLIASKLEPLVPFSACALFLAHNDTFECRFASGVDAQVLRRLTHLRQDGLVGRAVQGGRPIVNGDPSLDLRASSTRTGNLSLRSALVCPLGFQQMVGALAVYHVQPDYYGENDARLLQRVARQAAAVICNATLFERARAESMTDALTELPNRRFLASHATREVTRAQRNGIELALLMIDLDDFKVINDRYGHGAGDDALKAVAATLRKSLRPYDVCTRYGGDEFVMLLAGCSAEMAAKKSAELQRAVEDLRFEVADGTRLELRFSVGIAVLPHDGANYETLLALADARMYAHKMNLKLQQIS